MYEKECDLKIPVSTWLKQIVSDFSEEVPLLSHDYFHALKYHQTTGIFFCFVGVGILYIE